MLGINRHLPALPMIDWGKAFTTLCTSHRNNVASLHWLGSPSRCCSEARGGTVGAVDAPGLLGALIHPNHTLVHWGFPVDPPASDTPYSDPLGFSPESCHVRGHPTALARNSKMVSHLISWAVCVSGRVTMLLSPGKHLQQQCLPDTVGLTAVNTALHLAKSLPYVYLDSPYQKIATQ